MVAYLDESLDQVERRSLETQINQIEGVISTRYITAQEALEDFLAHHEDDSAFDGIDADVLRDRIEIRVSSRDAEKIHNQLAQIQGIARIRSDKIAG
jgi:cell division protein FtsX